MNELHDLLMSFFFDFKGNKSFTRFNCGLNRYWMGINQDAFIQWKRIVRDSGGIYGIVDQLTEENKTRLIRQLTGDRAA